VLCHLCFFGLFFVVLCNIPNLLWMFVYGFITLFTLCHFVTKMRRRSNYHFDRGSNYLDTF
jgi:hypothetical protein